VMERQKAHGSGKPLATKRLERAAAAALLILFVARCGHMAWVTSPTFDEPGYIFSGYSYFVEGRFDRTFEHPPLARAIVAAPLLLLRPKFAPDFDQMKRHHGYDVRLSEPEPQLAFQFLFIHNRARAQTMLFLARMAALVVAVATGVALWRWARALYGPPAGLLAMTLFTFDPNVLAHSANASGDMIFACALFAACYAWWRFVQKESWLRLILAGGLLGAAVSMRLLGAAGLGMFGLILVAERGGRARQSASDGGDDTRSTVAGRFAWRVVPQFIVMAAIAVFVLFSAYAFETGRPKDLLKWPQVVREANFDKEPAWASARLPLPNLLLGAYWQRVHVKVGHPAFLLGQVSRHGWWYYFPVAFLLKTPIGLVALVLFAMALSVMLARAEGVRRELVLLLPAVMFGAARMGLGINIGYRFLLPLLLFLFVLAGKAAHPLVLGGWWLRFVPLAACAWVGFGSLMLHPHYLAYFNELVGGPRNGYKCLVDSNLDWGQALPALKEWMDEHGVKEVNLSYFGSGDPAYYGIKYQDMLGLNWLRPTVRYQPHLRPPAEYYAVSATNLQGVYFEKSGPPASSDPFKLFRRMKPVGQAGYSILIYHAGGAE